MSKTTEVSVLTANRLGDGIVVFLDFEGAWSESLAEAVVARSPDEVRALQDRGTYDAEHNLVVEPYLIEVRETAGGLVPIRYRERVRAAGPSILEDVPGYVEPAPGAVVRQAHHDGGDRGPRTQPREPQTHPRPELVEGRAADATHAQAA
jgi:sulfite reductase (NADPH) hemoprotein beta-component